VGEEYEEEEKERKEERKWQLSDLSSIISFAQRKNLLDHGIIMRGFGRGEL
jgi:hypothetical protein